MHFETLKTNFAKYGQGHVVEDIDKFEEEVLSKFVHQLANIELPTMEKIFDQCVREDVVSESQKGGVLGAPRVFEKKLFSSFWAGLGASAIASSHVAVVIRAYGCINGDRSPSLDEMIVPSKKTALQYQIERLITLKRRIFEQTGKVPNILLYIISDSWSYHSVKTYLKQNQFFHYPKDEVFVYATSNIPCLSKEGKLVLDSPDHLAESSSGLIDALRSNKVLEHMQKRRVHLVHIINGNNALALPADPMFVGFLLDKASDMCVKVASKEKLKEYGLSVPKNPISLFFTEKYGHSFMNEHNVEESTMKELPTSYVDTEDYMFTLKYLYEACEQSQRTLPYDATPFELRCLEMDSSFKTVRCLRFHRRICDLSRFTNQIEALEASPKEQCFQTGDLPLLLGQRAHTSLKELNCTIMGHSPYVEISPLVTYNGEGLETIRNSTFDGTVILCSPNDNDIEGIQATVREIPLTTAKDGITSLLTFQLALSHSSHPECFDVETPHLRFQPLWMLARAQELRKDGEFADALDLLLRFFDLEVVSGAQGGFKISELWPLLRFSTFSLLRECAREIKDSDVLLMASIAEFFQVGDRSEESVKECSTDLIHALSLIGENVEHDLELFSSSAHINSSTSPSQSNCPFWWNIGFSCSEAIVTEPLAATLKIVTSVPDFQLPIKSIKVEFEQTEFSLDIEGPLSIGDSFEHTFDFEAPDGHILKPVALILQFTTPSGSCTLHLPKVFDSIIPVCVPLMSERKEVKRSLSSSMSALSIKPRFHPILTINPQSIKAKFIIQNNGPALCGEAFIVNLNVSPDVPLPTGARLKAWIAPHAGVTVTTAPVWKGSSSADVELITNSSTGKLQNCNHQLTWLPSHVGKVDVFFSIYVPGTAHFYHPCQSNTLLVVEPPLKIEPSILQSDSMDKSCIIDITNSNSKHELKLKSVQVISTSYTEEIPSKLVLKPSDTTQLACVIPHKTLANQQTLIVRGIWSRVESQEGGEPHIVSMSDALLDVSGLIPSPSHHGVSAEVITPSECIAGVPFPLKMNVSNASDYIRNVDIKFTKTSTTLLMSGIGTWKKALEPHSSVEISITINESSFGLRSLPLITCSVDGDDIPIKRVDRVFVAPQ
eukprot:TRINITY_DN31528_c0_g1_i1.p1 TRINITY_DN31528_c0_g1~~TRINITY_DN31528_c0_g1_i1.p1  ORF type:complete len:1117 (-),score=293.73 TRINITY_DN31528_c0_g1_i1:187-3537(-)